MAKRTKADLLRENEELTRKLVENNIIKTPTMMDKIEAVEAEAAKTIEFIIAETEKKTGRAFDRYKLSQPKSFLISHDPDKRKTFCTNTLTCPHQKSGQNVLCKADFLCIKQVEETQA